MLLPSVDAAAATDEFWLPRSSVIGVCRCGKSAETLEALDK
jgi:hypothetical protein